MTILAMHLLQNANYQLCMVHQIAITHIFTAWQTTWGAMTSACCSCKRSDSGFLSMTQTLDNFVHDCVNSSSRNWMKKYLAINSDLYYTFQ